MEITKKSKTINSNIGLSIYLVEDGEGHNLQLNTRTTKKQTTAQNKL